MKMKRLLGFMMLASAVPAIFSCNKADELDPVMEPREMVITAVREGSEPGTKTEIVSGKTYWSVADEISVFFGAGTAGGAKFTSTNTEPSTTADFSGILNAVTGSTGGAEQKYFWGVYPFNEENAVTLNGSSNFLTTVVPDAQYGKADSFSEGQNIAVGRSTGLEMSFRNLLSGLKFTFNRSDITRVVVRGNNGEYLAGKVNVSMDSGDPVVTSVLEGKTQVSLTMEDQSAFEVGPVYQVLFLPTNFTQGLTVTFYASNGSVGKRTYKANNYERNAPKSSTNADSGATFVSPSFVDMGNGLKIATFNMGANSPEDAGDLFAWGETRAKSKYAWDNYKYGSSETSLTKYVGSSEYGSPVDRRTQLEAMDDPATMSWGSGWRVPTIKELKTLCDDTYYTWEWTTNYNSTGVRGYIVTSKSTSKTIFLPANIGREGMYWSSTVYSRSSDRAQNMFFSQMNGYLADYVAPRYMGYGIRPIYAERKAVTGISLSVAETYELLENRNFWPTATITPADAYEQELIWTSSDPNVLDVSAGAAAGVQASFKTGTAGKTTVTVRTVDGGFTATCNLTVNTLATGVSLDQTSYSFFGYPNSSTMKPLQLIATVTPSSASQVVEWYSSNENVATVSASGLVTPVGNGTAVITAVKNGVYEATCSVSVDAWEYVSAIELSPTLLIQSGESVTLTPVISPATATDQRVEWSTLEPLVATVTQDGVVTGARPGVAVILVAAKDQEGAHAASCIVTVCSGYENGQPYVDWGNGYNVSPFNLKSSWSPIGYSTYYHWGDTRPTPGWAYSWNDYKFFLKWGENNTPLMSKYVVSPDTDLGYNYADGKLELEPTDDPAIIMGGRWVTPSKEEWEYILSRSYTQEWTINGVKGIMMHARDNNMASVFIPYSGFGKNSVAQPIMMDEVGETAYLWTRTVVKQWPHQAVCVEFSKSGGYVRATGHARRVVMNIRPIFRK